MILDGELSLGTQLDGELDLEEQFDGEFGMAFQNIQSEGARYWNELLNKPFNTIGDNLKVESGALMVDTVNAVEEDNTKPITSAAVYTEVGNISALLSSI